MFTAITDKAEGGEQRSMLPRTPELPWKHGLLNEFAGKGERKRSSPNCSINYTNLLSPSPGLPGENRGCNSQCVEPMLLMLAATSAVHTGTHIAHTDTMYL